MSTRQSEEKAKHQKALAVIICLFIGLIYVETIWKPYFYGIQVQAPQQVAQKTSSAPSSVAQLQNNQPQSNGTQASVTSGQSVDEQAGFPSTAQLQAAGTFRVITDELNVEMSLLGGRVISAGLEKYKQDQGNDTDLELVKHQEQSEYPLGISNGESKDLWTEYRVISPAELRGSLGTITLEKGETEKIVVLRGALSDGREVTKKLTFKPEGFFVDAEFSLSAANPTSDPLVVNWNRQVREEDDNGQDYYKAAGFVWFDGQKAQRIAFTDVEKPEEDLGKVRWLTLGDKYFAAIFIAPGEMVPAKYTDKGDVYASEFYGGDTSNSFTLFLGPKSYRLLGKLGNELQRNIDFGFFGIVSAPLLSLLHLLYGLLQNYGLAIVALTILVRLAMFPLNSASFKQMKAMQDLKPELDKLKETVKDKQKQQAALMELYKKKGVNPLGGCLPMFLQMPIFIGLYAGLLLSVELRHAPFTAWITDLSGPEALMVGGIGIPVMVILFVLSMVAQQMTTPSTMDPTQKKVMMVMPIVMGVIFAKMPAGLTLYWLTSNLISVGQHKAMHYKEGDPKAALKITLMVSAAVFALACFVVAIG